MQQALIALLLWFAALPAPAADKAVAPEHYGMLPNVRSVAISPDGDKYAFILRGAEHDVFLIRDAKTLEIIGGADTQEVKPRAVFFASNRHVILIGSETERIIGTTDKFERSGAVVYDVKTDKMRLLMNRAKDAYGFQFGLSNIVGVNSRKGIAYMPAWVGQRTLRYDLFRVSLKTGIGKRHGRGTAHTEQWLMNKRGKVVARVDFHEGENEQRLYSKLSGEWKLIFTHGADVPEVSFAAVTEDGKHVVIVDGRDGKHGAYTMSLVDGSIEGRLLKNTRRGIDRVLTSGPYRIYAGVKLSGLLPSYEYIDREKAMHVATVQAQYPRSAVHPVSATEDWSKIIFEVSGQDAANDYVEFDSQARQLKKIASGYPDIAQGDIAEIKAMRYKARDGLSIEAILTWPTDVAERRNLPLLVMPHGGPASYDSVRFDWWAQYYARRGYLVLQPNFRGSTGRGDEFMEAGHGKWGKEMQDDLTDGVNAMVNAGYADPDRVCIMGASYGGYAALAGGAFTPELYRCVIAVAGVSDLPWMLREERERYGHDHWVVSYWNDVIGDSKEESDKLDAISPVNHASAFDAPVLLLHGKDDTVVPLTQSSRMARALEKAEKTVAMVKLEGEDHWLSSGDTRIELLRQIDDFLDLHNPAF